MKTPEKRRLTVLSGVALAILAVAVLGRRPAADLVASVQSFGPASEAQATLARTRSLLRLPLAAGREELPGQVSGGAETEANATARARAELNRLGPLLSDDADQLRRLQALGEQLDRRPLEEGPDGAGEREWGVRVEELLGGLERDQRARTRRLDAVARSALHDLALIAAASGAGLVVFILLGLSLTLWERSRRHLSVRLATRLRDGQRRLADRLRFLDQYDPLTGLPNRRRLGALLEEGRLPGQGGAPGVGGARHRHRPAQARQRPLRRRDR